MNHGRPFAHRRAVAPASEFSRRTNEPSFTHARYLAAVFTVLALAACTAAPKVKVTAEASRTWSPARYVTYRWSSPPAEDESGQPTTTRVIVDWQIRNAVEQALAARGFIKQTTGTPDFIVSYYASRRDAHTESFKDYWEYWERGGQLGASEAFVFGYEEGVLLLEFHDARTHEPIWRARAAAVSDPAKRRAQIDEAVRAMIDRLPALSVPLPVSPG